MAERKTGMRMALGLELGLDTKGWLWQGLGPGYGLGQCSRILLSLIFQATRQLHTYARLRMASAPFRRKRKAGGGPEKQTALSAKKWRTGKCGRRWR